MLVVVDGARVCGEGGAIKAIVYVDVSVALEPESDLVAVTLNRCVPVVYSGERIQKPCRSELVQSGVVFGP